MKKTYKHWFVYICISISVLLLILAVYVNWNEIKQIDIKVEEFTLELIVSMIISFVTFLLAIVSLNFFRKRVKNQDKQVQEQVKQVILQREQIDFQIVQRTDERFTTAVNLLGSNESSARTGAIYALYHLAVDGEKYRGQIAQILCSHIRSKTQESDYQEEDNHKERPSNEIQTCINLLFKPKSKSEGLYIKYAADLNEADLSHAYLVGADFSEVRFQGARFSDTQCQGANFSLAQCEGANFSSAQCESANFRLAQCQGVSFFNAQCQSANFSSAQCQGTDFSHSHCQGANFSSAQCQGAYFSDAQCQGANFSDAKCQGADFMSTDLKGAYALGGVSRTKLAGRVGKDTELQNMVFVGRLEAEAITQIKAAKEYISDNEYQKLEEIIEAHKDNETDCTAPDDIITGVLEDS